MKTELLNFIENELKEIPNQDKVKKHNNNIKKEALVYYQELIISNYSEESAYIKTKKYLTTYVAGFVNIYALKNNLPYFSKYTIYNIVFIALCICFILLFHELFVIHSILYYVVLILSLVTLITAVLTTKKHKMFLIICSLLLATVLIKSHFDYLAIMNKYNTPFINNSFPPFVFLWGLNITIQNIIKNKLKQEAVY